MLFLDLTVYQIHTGTHPFLGPKREETGTVTQSKKAKSDAVNNAATAGVGASMLKDSKMANAHAPGNTKPGRESRGSSLQFMNLNGVPIPFFGPKSTD
jgi:hypothetical protein